MASKGIREDSFHSERTWEREGKASPGTVEATVRVMGENGERVARSVWTDSGVSIGTFDAASRDGYPDCFDRMEQAVIQTRNEASGETAEAFLKESEKTDEATPAIRERFLESELGAVSVPVQRAVSQRMRNTEHLWSRKMVKIMETACIENANRIVHRTVDAPLRREGNAQSLKLRATTDLCDRHGKEAEEHRERQAKSVLQGKCRNPETGLLQEGGTVRRCQVLLWNIVSVGKPIWA